MKKLLAVLGAIALTTTSTTSLISCSAISLGGSIPGGGRDQPSDEPTPIMDHDSTQAAMQLSANSIDGWTQIYHSYNDESNENLENYQEATTVPNNDPTDSDDDDSDDGPNYDPNDPDAVRGLASALATLQTYYLWYRVVARYALMQMRFLNEGININNVNWSSWATKDLQTLTSLFYSLNDIEDLSKQFNTQLDSFLKNNLGDENYDGDTELQEQDKADWKRVITVVNSYYLDSLSKVKGQMLAAIKWINPSFNPNLLIKFDNPLNYVMNSNSTTAVKLVNGNILFLFKSLLLDDSLDKGISVKPVNNNWNTISITINASVKSGSWVRFRIYEQKNQQLPPTTPSEMNKLDEIIALYVN